MKERFMKIQSGLQDDTDQMKDRLETVDQQCQKESALLVKEIESDQELLAEAQTKLAAATEKENDAGQAATQIAEEHEQLSAELKKTMKDCSTDYVNLEGEICALKKVRGEVVKMKSSGAGTMQDCQVSPWTSQGCSEKC